MTEYILINVPSYGWLCKINHDGKEIYRGEYQIDPHYALETAMDWQDTLDLQRMAANLAAATPPAEREELLKELREGY